MRKLIVDTLLFILVWSLLAFTIFAKPDRPTPKKDAPIPNLAGPSNWGQISQDGRKITVTGHERWTAEGEIRKDGTVYLLWTQVSDGKRAPGLYQVKDEGIFGLWNWGEYVEVLPSGEMKGLELSDTLRAKPEIN